MMGPELRLPKEWENEPAFWARLPPAGVSLVRELAEARLFQLGRRRAVVCGITGALLAAAVPASGAFAAGTAWWEVLGTLLLVWAAAAFFFHEFILDLGVSQAKERLESLAPIRNNPVQCEDALELVKQREEARDYRDEVLANGRELLVVDVECMRWIRKSPQVQSAEAQELYRQVCEAGTVAS